MKKIFFLTLVIFLATSTVVLAADQQIVLTPAKREITLSPGQARTEYFQLTNQSVSLVTVKVGAEELAAETYSVLPYLDFKERQFVLAPGQTHKVPVTITLPSSVLPGGFYGTITFSLTSDNGEGSTRVVTQVGSLLFVRVPGAVKTEGKLVSASYSNKTFLINFSNTGSIYLNPYGELILEPILVGTKKFLLIEPWYVLPQTGRVREIKSPPLVPGFYRASVSLNRGYGDIVDQASLVFVVWSPLMMMLAAALLLVVILLIIMLKRRLLIILLFFALTTSVYAEVASSSSYQIQVDSLNFGGNLSSSTSYEIGDTLGEVGTGTSTSATYSLHAGYRQMDGSYLAISAPTSITMSPDIDGPGDTALGSAVWTVTTDNPTGYTLDIKAATSPALSTGGESFADYTPAGATPDYVWSVATNDSEFGFSPEGTDIDDTYKDNGSACGVGALDTTDRCWSYFLTTDQKIARSATSNSPTGTATTVKIQAATGASKTQGAGGYSATLTVTALVQ